MNAVEPILQDNKDRFVIFPIQHHDIWEWYKKCEASFCGMTENLPQLKGKINTEKSQIFLCQNQTCSAPLTQSTKAVEMLKSMIS